MFETGQKVYWVKYALTSGIHERTLGEKCTTEGLWFLERKPNESFIMVYEKEIYTNIDDAMKASEGLRDKKLKSLQKQIDKLKNLEIKVN